VVFNSLAGHKSRFLASKGRGKIKDLQARSPSMVTMACIDCGAVHFEAATLREMLTAMMPHYFEDHKDIMAGESSVSRETWMARFTAAFTELQDAEKI
jgi:hypothetical protein